jgi:circadian clock protein KaiB
MPLPKAPKRRKRLFDLQLFVAGSGVRSLRTIESVKRACEKHAPGQYHLSIVDIYLNPQEAFLSQIIAVPTLICKLPQPLRMYVGEIRRPADLDRHFATLPALA